MGESPDNLDDASPVEPVTTVAVPPAGTPKEIERKDFIETFTVREKDKLYEVAANAVANRALMQINVAKLRQMCERTMDVYLKDNLPVDSKTLKTIVEAVSTVEEMSDAAYGDGKAGKLGNALERLVYATTRAAIDGGAKLAGNNAEARLLRLKRIGKRPDKKADVIDIK